MWELLYADELFSNCLRTAVIFFFDYVYGQRGGDVLCKSH